MRKYFAAAIMVLLLLGAFAGAAAAQAFDGFAVGMLEDAAMHSLLVHTDDGRALSFGMDDGTAVEAPQGLIIGERVLVRFDGAAEGSPVAGQVTVLSSIMGKVTDATMNTVTIETDDGQRYLFKEDDDTSTIATKGVTINAPVEIAYEGDMTDGVEEQAVKVWEVFVGNKLTGEVEQVDTQTLDIDADGTSYTFAIDQASVVNGAYLKRGNTATVKFFGALDENANVQQVRVVEVDGQEPPAPAPTPTPAPSKHSLEGVVEDASMHTITVRTAKHNLYTFEKRDTTKIKGKTGISVGDTVKVSYTGDLNSHHDVQKVKVREIKVVKNKEHEQPHGATEEAIMGVVMDATMNTFTIKADHVKYIFEKDDDTDISQVDGMYVGETVKVYYTGKLHKTKKVQPVQVTRVVGKDG